jgi:DNA-binding NtrC family response regulator
MWVLVAESGEQAGACWHVGEDPLTIGRGAGSEIFLRDTSVSRKHCVIEVNEDGIHFIDQGGSNTTLLNGSPESTGRLQIGDKLTVGQTVFIVGATKNGLPNKGTLAGLDSTVQIIPNPIPDMPSNGVEAEGNPQTVEDLYWIFDACRSLSMVRGREHFLEQLVDQLKKRFKLDGLLIQGLHAPASTAKNVYQEGILCDQNGSTPKAIVEGLEFLHSGKCFVDTTVNGKVCSVVSPIMVGKDRIGSILIQTSTCKDGYCSQALEALVAFGKSIGPLYQSVSAVERMVLKQGYVSDEREEAISLNGNSDAMRAVFQAMQAATRSELPVLIQGESGSGKEVIARELHKISTRHEAPLITVNCAAIPSTSFESELFGCTQDEHANRSSKGRFEMAHTGIILLDEINTLTQENQALLLHVLEKGTYTKVGSSEEIQLNVRVFCSTNLDLQTVVASGSFREDLYLYISGILVQVPPLRERKSDIGVLAEYFASETCFQMNELPKTFSTEAMQKLLQWDWPGNVRELRMCIDRAVAYSQSATIAPDEIMLQHTVAVPEAALSLADIEKEHIIRLLQDNKGNISATAKQLGISRTTLYHKLEEYGVRS